jgi:aspartate aminotransferase-like enzyme
MRRPRTSGNIIYKGDSIIVYKAGSFGDKLGEFESLTELAKIEAKKLRKNKEHWVGIIRKILTSSDNAKRYKSDHFGCMVAPRYKK